MTTSAPRSSLCVLLAAWLLTACADAARDDASTCLDPDQRAAYDLAYDLGAGEGDASALRELDSDAAASCALAGTRAGLRNGRRGGRGHGRRHGDRHHGGRRQGRDCSDDEARECREDGRFTGQVSAAAYCQLSISLGGLGVDDLLAPGPESRCSRKYEEACQKAFDRAALDFAALSGDPGADCRPFMRGEFREAYEVARFNQCLLSVAGVGDGP
jgi:hypothetical protein